MPQPHRFWRFANMANAQGGNLVTFSMLAPYGADGNEAVYSFQIGTATLVTASGTGNSTIEASVGTEAYQPTTLNGNDTPEDPAAPWVKFDFGSEPRALVSADFRTTPGAGGQQPDQFALQWSDDGASWTTQCTRTLNNGVMADNTTYAVGLVDYEIAGVITTDGGPPPAPGGVVIVVDRWLDTKSALTDAAGNFSILMQDPSPVTVIAAGSETDNAKVYSNVTPVEKV